MKHLKICFKNHSYVINDAELKEYSKNWHKPAVAKDLARYDQVDPDTKVEMLFQPRGAQIEALCALENSRAEGACAWFGSRCNRCGKNIFGCI